MTRADDKWLDRRMAETPGERLRSARLRAGYGKAVDAARAFGWEPPTYHAHENGTRGLTARAAAKYARAYHVLPSWLLFGDGADAALIATPVGDSASDDLVRRTLDMLTALILAGDLRAAAETAEGLTHLLRARLSREDGA